MKNLSNLLTVSECLDLSKQLKSIKLDRIWYSYSLHDLALIHIVLYPMCRNVRIIDRAILMTEMISERLMKIVLAENQNIDDIRQYL